MAQSRLIGDYLAELSAQLPAAIVAELADGLDQTHQRYLGQGLSRDAAAIAALAEFGEPHVIIAAFTCSSPARGAARRLLATGPVIGACWGTALILNRAWTWPVPAAAPILLGTALITVIGLLAARRVWQPLPVSFPRRNRGMPGHHRAGRRHDHRHHARCPGRDLAHHRGHGSQRGPSRLHDAPPALGPGQLARRHASCPECLSSSQRIAHARDLGEDTQTVWRTSPARLPMFRGPPGKACPETDP